MDKNQTKYQNFTSLNAWQAARQLQMDIFELTRTFPSEEKFRLSDQIIRSSISIGANLAEGHGRYHFQEQIRYCINARGSLTESLNHLITAFDCKYISQDQLQNFKEKYNNLLKLINGYIPFLKKQKLQPIKPITQ